MIRPRPRAAGKPSPRAPLVEDGLRHHQAGRLDAARDCYLKALARQPNDADALHLLGVLHHQQGDAAEAATLIRRAIVIRPEYPEARCNLGAALATAGHLEEAAAAFRSAIAQRPEYPAALNNLGDVLRRLGQPDEAVGQLQRALDLNPTYAEAHRNLATAFTALDKPEQAAAALRRAIALRPNDAEARAELGALLIGIGQPQEAAAALGQALTLNPNSGEWRNNLAAAFIKMRRFNEAIAHLKQALALDANVAERHNNLGVALTGLGRFDEAAAAYRRAIAIRPDYADAHGSLSNCLLTLGDLRQGFEEYRWRWQSPDFTEVPPAFSCPRWEGEALAGKSILAFCEQGFGDSLQFIRYAARLPRMAARVTVLAPPPLQSLFRSIPGIEVADACRDEFDYAIPLMCLPRLFGTELDTIPAEVPYLSPDPAKVADWAGRLGTSSGLTRIGLVWAGDPGKRNLEKRAVDARRSVTLGHFAPLAGTAGVQFVSLQKGEPAKEARHPPQGLPLIDMTADLHDFADTAALIANLDLVISVDTSVAHLAGALGKPVWLLNRFDTCWRWLLDRADSPWYPTLRQFRQPQPGDWTSVMEMVRAALHGLTAGPRERAP